MKKGRCSMDKSTSRKSLQRICEEIATDMRNDASAFDGAPFNGKTVATYLGNQGAAIAALARMLALVIGEDAKGVTDCDSSSESKTAVGAVAGSVGGVGERSTRA